MQCDGGSNDNKYPWWYNFFLILNFFLGNATDFLPGPIYDLNQIGQVVAGMYSHDMIY